MMKRSLALVLALLMLASASACSGSDEAVSNETADATGEVTEEVTEKAEATDTTPSVYTEYPIDAELTRGKVEGQKYTSTYTGLNFTAPEGWKYSSDVTMAELLNMGQEMLSEENIADTLAGATTVFDMIATETSTGNNVSVSYENMERICGKAVNAEEYMEILKQRVGAQMQVEYEFKDEAEVTLSGHKYRRVVAAISSDMFKMTQAYYIRVIDDVAVCITATFIKEIPAADIEAMFE